MRFHEMIRLKRLAQWLRWRVAENAQEPPPIIDIPEYRNAVIPSPFEDIRPPPDPTH